MRQRKRKRRKERVKIDREKEKYRETDRLTNNQIVPSPDMLATLKSKKDLNIGREKIFR